MMNRLNRIIKKLADEQHPDGSFGRFHTENTKLKQRISTTQAATWLMYENSLTRENDICNKTCLYMERLINDISLWPDNWEKNKWFKPAVPFFVASSLSLFGSDDEKYDYICRIWIEILISAFETGEYSKEQINTTAKSLIGVEIDGSYIGLQSLYNLALYAFNAGKIPVVTQRIYLKWLHHYDGVITYTKIRPNSLSTNSEKNRVISLLERFAGFEDEFRPANVIDFR